ncbi:hypothetical protein IWW51_000173 [Coemansia sp. RSA 2702]|nr:hypothetical protein IWW51_000173 [Coemansia sp. RSA 2702]
MANRLVEFLIAVVFLGQYVLRYVVINANHRAIEHAVVVFAFIAPMVAYFTSIHNDKVRDSYMSAGVMAIFYPARFLRLHYAVYRLVAMAASSNSFIHLTLIRQEVVSLCSDIIVAILFFASLVHSGVNWYSQSNHVQYEGFSFLDTIYSIVMDLAINTSAFSKTVALPAATRHALVCGHIELDSIRQFLHEFFNADHGPNIFKTTIVILHTDEPTLEMKSLLRDPMYANRVFYVKGHGSGIDEDAETVLTALALNAFSAPLADTQKNEQQQPKFQVFAQTILPGSIAHLTYLQTSRIACVDELRLGIMAQNCATPGFAALAFMLSTSVASHIHWDYSGLFKEDIATSADDGWVKSYIHGLNQEIYQAHVPSSLAGKSFFKAARYFYRCHGMLVFGVGALSNTRSPHSQTPHHPRISDSTYYQVMLAPRNHTLQPSDMLFAIAKDVHAVLDAVTYAERVRMRTKDIRRNPPSNHTTTATSRVTLAGGHHNSPLRMLSPRTKSTKSRPQINYISDSDSSSGYFSPAHNAMDLGTIRGQPNDSSMVKPRKIDRVPGDLSNHVVVCDASPQFPRSIALLVQSLKDAFEDSELPIVILSPGEPDAQQAAMLGDFAGVYVVRGTPLAQPDLQRTLIERAQKAIVLSSNNNSSNSSSSGDSAAILANMNIQQLCGTQFFVTTELLDIENIRYLDHTQLLGEPLLKRTFMGGHIFMPALIDTALCQCYFSSHVLDVMRHLTFSHTGTSAARATVATPRCRESAAVSAARPGRLSLLYVPARFIGQRYDTLVLTLMKQHGAVALGLYRVVSHNAQAFAAVMCNPQPASALAAADAVYVLGPEIAGWAHVSEGLRPAASLLPGSPGASKEGGTGSSQSRHTVYSHNTACTPADPEHVTFAPTAEDLA